MEKMGNNMWRFFLNIFLLEVVVIQMSNFQIVTEKHSCQAY